MHLQCLCISHFLQKVYLFFIFSLCLYINCKITLVILVIVCLNSTLPFHLQGIQKVLTDCVVAHSSWLEADGTLCDNFALVSSCKAKGLQLAAVIALSKVLIKPDDWEYFGDHAAAQCIRQFVDSTHKRMEQWMASALHLAMAVPCLRPYTQIICKLLQSHIRCCSSTVYS